MRSSKKERPEDGDQERTVDGKQSNFNKTVQPDADDHSSREKEAAESSSLGTKRNRQSAVSSTRLMSEEREGPVNGRRTFTVFNPV